MSHLHFVANEVYRDRVIQMGEQPDRVFVTGAPGIDLIRTTPPTPAAELERRIGMKFAIRSVDRHASPDNAGIRCDRDAISRANGRARRGRPADPVHLSER